MEKFLRNRTKCAEWSSVGRYKGKIKRNRKTSFHRWLCDWAPSINGTIYKCWTCSQIYMDFLGTCVWMSASSMGKLSKVMTISLPFFSPLCVWTLQPLELSQHSATDTGRTCYLNYNHSIVYIFETVHLVHLFHIHLCSFSADIFWIGNFGIKWSWIVAETVTLIFANHICTFISVFFFFFFLPIPVLTSLQQLFKTSWR